MLEAPFPSPEQAFLPLSRHLDTPPLPASPAWPRLWARLRLALNRESLSAAHRAIGQSANQENRRALALLSRGIAHQTASLSCLLSPEEGAEEKMVWLSLLSLETAAALAQRMNAGALRQTVDFLLPEYQDALYRAANLLELLGRGPVQALIGWEAEILPGRPLAAAQRHPLDGIAHPIPTPSLWEQLSLSLLCALEEEKLSFFSQAAQTGSPLSRGLFLELALLSEDYACRFHSLTPRMEDTRRLAWARFAACYLDSSCAEAVDFPLCDFAARQAEQDAGQIDQIRRLFPQSAAALPQALSFPPPLRWGLSKGYVRDTLSAIGETALREGFSPVGSLPPGADFFRYQKRVCPPGAPLPSSQIIEEIIGRQGQDARFEIAPHPVEALRDRKSDHADLGR